VGGFRGLNCREGAELLRRAAAGRRGLLPIRTAAKKGDIRRCPAVPFIARTGKAEPIDEFPTRGEREFRPPDPGEALDWVLVLDDAGKNYPPSRHARGPVVYLRTVSSWEQPGESL